MNNTLYVPTWLYVVSSTYLNLTKLFFTFPIAHIIHVFNHNMVGLMINGPISQQPGPIKSIRPPGIFGAISAIIIEYIMSVYTPLRYHRARAVCSSPGIIYMRSFGSFWLYLQYVITPSYIIYFTC